jgi:hypothetical protein
MRSSIPALFDYVARVIAWRFRTTKEVDRALWTEVARVTASQNGKLGRDSEVVWALWLLKELKQRIPKSLSDILLINNGGLVLGLLAHFPIHGLATDKKLYSSMRDIVEGDPFAGPFWPLTLELSHLAQDDPKWGAVPRLVYCELCTMQRFRSSTGMRCQKYFLKRAIITMTGRIMPLKIMDQTIAKMAKMMMSKKRGRSGADCNLFQAFVI